MKEIGREDGAKEGLKREEDGRKVDRTESYVPRVSSSQIYLLGGVDAVEFVNTLQLKVKYEYEYNFTITVLRTSTTLTQDLRVFVGAVVMMFGLLRSEMVWARLALESCL